MKKIFSNIKTLAALLMVGAAFTACSNSDDSIIEQSENVKTYKLTIKASKEDIQSSTRATITEEGGNLVTKWYGYEYVYVYNNVGTKCDGGLTATAMNGGTWADLNGAFKGANIEADNELTLKIEANSNYYTYQKGNLEDIASDFYKAEATVEIERITNAYGDGSAEIKAKQTARFESKQAIVKFTLLDKKTSNSTPAGILSMDVVVTDDQSYHIVPSNHSGSSQQDNEVYVAMDGFTNKKVTLTVHANTGDYTYIKENATFENGKFYPVTVKMTKN